MSASIFRYSRVAKPLCALASSMALLATPLAFAASKNVLYKCVDPAGVISIQSVACSKGSTEAWRRDATPEPPLTPQQAAQLEAKTLRDQQTVREQVEIVDRKLQPAPPAPEPAAPVAPIAGAEAPKEAVEADPCESAQVFASSVREKEWLQLSDEQVRRLYSWVAERCKGSPKAR